MRTALLGSIMMLTLVFTSGCGHSRDGTPDAGQGPNCGRPSSTIQVKLEGYARTNFVTSGGSHIARFEVRDATTYPIPASMQFEGMTTIVQLWGTTWFTQALGAKVSGVDGGAGFVSNADGSRIFALDDSARTLFSLPKPDARMAEWIDQFESAANDEKSLECPHA